MHNKCLQILISSLILQFIAALLWDTFSKSLRVTYILARNRLLHGYKSKMLPLLLCTTCCCDGLGCVCVDVWNCSGHQGGAKQKLVMIARIRQSSIRRKYVLRWKICIAGIAPIGGKWKVVLFGGLVMLACAYVRVER